jgi:predicted PurR-regulated permease PerM
MVAPLRGAALPVSHFSLNLLRTSGASEGLRKTLNMVQSEQSPSRISQLLPVLAALGILYFARDVLIPLSLAALFAFLLTPAVKRFESWRLGRIPAVMLAVLISCFFVAGLAWLAGNQLIDALNELPNYKENIRQKVDTLRGASKGGLAKAGESVKELTKELAGAEPPQPPPPLSKRATTPPPLQPKVEKPVLVQLVEAPPTILQSIKSFLGPLLEPIATAVIVLVFAVVMMVKREDLRSRLLRLIGQGQLNVATEAFDDAAQRVSRYLRLQFLVNSTFGFLLTVGLYFIGVPNSLLWGVLAGTLRFIPYVGVILGAASPLVVALATSDHWLQPLLCLGLFLVIEPLTAYVVEPALYGSHTGLSALAILVAATVWTALWGPIGLVLSTPLTACVVVIGRYVPHLHYLYILLGDEPVLSPSAQLYQRLLAMDQAEAQALIEQFSKDRSLMELYDDVVIPALGMAEEDRHKGQLDETRETFLLQALEEFVAELPYESAALPGTIESPAGADTPTTPPRKLVCPSRVVCLPAGDKADEISGAMLSQVLERLGCATISFPVVSSPVAVLENFSTEPGDIVCVSALPPFALMKARSLSKELRSRFPELRILVGLWGFSGGGAKADERLGKAFTVEVVTTIGQAVEKICPATAPSEPV